MALHRQSGGGEPIPPGEPMSMEQHMLDKVCQMMQFLKPIKQMNQHVCTFALYSDDMTRQIETHHYATRLNQDFLQCAVYDTDDSYGRLIGDRLPLGPPALMMSPQAVNLGMVKPEIVQKRDDKYNISSDALKTSRLEISEPEWLNPQADYWKQHRKGFKIDDETTDMKAEGTISLKYACMRVCNGVRMWVLGYLISRRCR